MHGFNLDTCTVLNYKIFLKWKLNEMRFEIVLQVSIFLKDKVQNSNGRFVLPTGGAVPYGAEVPGTIK